MAAIAGDPKTLTISSTWTRLGTPQSNEFKIYTTETGTNKKPTQEATRSDAVITIIPAPASGTLGLLLLARASRRRHRSNSRPHRTAARALAISIAASLLVTAAHAQCEPAWLPGDLVAGVDGMNGDVHTFTTWDPDGPGPLAEHLVIGGDFEVAGDVFTHNFAMWDGHTWSTLNATYFTGGAVNALTVYNGELIAGTEISSSATPYLSRWDGSRWVSLDVGGPVHALAVYHGELYAGGTFNRAGAVTASRIARWNGSTWSSVGIGVSGANSSVQDFLVHDGALLVGGTFATAGGSIARGVARWDGAAWSAVGEGPGDVYSLALYNAELYAGGKFETDKGSNLSRWNGATWQPIVASPTGVSSATGIFALRVYEGRLITGGRFTQSGSSSAYRHIAAWDGSTWDFMDGGLNDAVQALTIYQDRLIAGGHFRAGGAPAVVALGIASWNESTWAPLNPASVDFPNGEYDLRALAIYQGSLYAGRDTFTAEPLDGIRRWDGRAWTTPGGGIPEDVFALTVFDGRLIAGGDFSSAGGVTVQNIAAWDGLAWNALASPTPGISGDVHAFAAYDGELIAAGKFTGAGGVPASNIAAWNGSTWRALGAGTNNTIRALAVYNGELIAGGDFTTAGPPGSPAHHIARWDGSTWRALADGGVNNNVYALLVHDGELLIGGAFTETFTQSIAYLARWRGADWLPFPAPLEGTCPFPSFCESGVRALTLYNGRLIAAGKIIVPGAERLDAIVAWDGSSWSTLGATTRVGNANTINALAVYGPELIAGGAFYAVDGRAHYGWARYSAHACPADLTCDDVADFADYLEFLNLYDAQDPRADFTGDGVVDFADYLEFLNHFDAGC